MSFIELYASGKRLGQFDLPRSVTGVDGHVFDLRGAAQGGGNGVVFRASPRGALADDDNIAECALKFLRQQDAARVDRFANEGRILRELDHENIVQYFDQGTLSYVSLIGRARVVRDRVAKAAHWDQAWNAFYPDRDKSVVLIAVEAERLEIVSSTLGISGDAATWSPPTVRLRP